MDVRDTSVEELYRDCREDRLKVSPALKISRTKEGHAKLPIRETNTYVLGFRDLVRPFNQDTY